MDATHFCEGQSTYSSELLEGYVLRVMHNLFAMVKKRPKAEMLKAAKEHGKSAAVLALKQAEKELTKARRALEKLEEQTLLALTGEAELDLSVVNMLMPKQQAAVEAAQAAYDQIVTGQKSDEERASVRAYELEQMQTWADTFDTATLENQRMIISYLVEKVIVGSGNEIEVKLKVTAQQFLGIEIAA